MSRATSPPRSTATWISEPRSSQPLTYACGVGLLLAALYVGLCAYAFVAFGVHAWRERKQRLDRYLCELTGQGPPPRWLSPVLTALALLLTAGPLLASLFEWDHRHVLLSFLSGAVLADMLGTHVIPTMVSGKRSPALETWPVYLLIVAGFGWNHHELIPALAGAGSFLALWPGLLLLRLVRHWIREHRR